LIFRGNSRSSKLIDLQRAKPNASLHPAENLATPLIPSDISLLTPSRRGFERPSFCNIAILAVLCHITYPAFYVLTLVAKDKSLFVVRLIVSAWCSEIGFAFFSRSERNTLKQQVHCSRWLGIESFQDLTSNSRGHWFT